MLRFHSPPLLFLRSSGKRTPSRFPSVGPYGESCPFPETSFIYLSNTSIKILLIKKEKFYPTLEGSGKERPPMFPKTGPLWKQTPIFRALVGISFGVPSCTVLGCTRDEWGRVNPEERSSHVLRDGSKSCETETCHVTQ